MMAPCCPAAGLSGSWVIVSAFATARAGGMRKPGEIAHGEPGFDAGEGVSNPRHVGISARCVASNCNAVVGVCQSVRRAAQFPGERLRRSRGRPAGECLPRDLRRGARMPWPRRLLSAVCRCGHHPTALPTSRRGSAPEAGRRRRRALISRPPDGRRKASAAIHFALDARQDFELCRRETVTSIVASAVSRRPPRSRVAVGVADQVDAAPRAHEDGRHTAGRHRQQRLGRRGRCRSAPPAHSLDMTMLASGMFLTSRSHSLTAVLLDQRDRP